LRQHQRSVAIPIAAAVSVLALPAAATAHVTVNPKQAPAGAYTVLDVRVPTERDDASTVKVVVKMPPGIVSASYEPVAGWSAKIVSTRLAQPITTADGPISEAVSTITWTASRGGGGVIAPGQFRDFPISVQIPGKAGDVLTFKALQTYSNGEVVRWIGAPSADEPAPTLTVTAAGDSAGAATAGPSPTATTAAAAAPVAAIAGRDDDGSSKPLAIAALIVGALGLIAASVALLRGRRRTAV
jgi:uncharacterized protein YcnI